MSCEVDHALALSPSDSTLPSGSSSPRLSPPTYLARWLSSCMQTEGGGGPPPSPPRALQTVPSSTCLLHTAVVLLAEIPPPPSLLRFGWSCSKCLSSIGLRSCRSTKTPDVSFFVSICTPPPPLLVGVLLQLSHQKASALTSSSKHRIPFMVMKLILGDMSMRWWGRVFREKTC